MSHKWVGKIVHYGHPKWPHEPIAAIITSAEPLLHEYQVIIDPDAPENQVAIRLQLFCSPEQKDALGDACNNTHAWFSSVYRQGFWTWPQE